MLYAEFEEKFGLITHAVEVYDKMVEQVPKDQKERAFYIYISKVSHYLGITKTRSIFEVKIFLELNLFARKPLKFLQIKICLRWAKDMPD
jgi:hypothetical protein